MTGVIRESYKTDQSIPWERVHILPRYVYFNHSIHIAKGVGCYSCHGEVDQMPLMWKEHSLHMQWCLDCHRDPAKHIRSRDEIFVMQERTVPQGADGKTKDPHEYGRELMQLYGVRTDIPREHGDEKFPNPLTNCSTCHY
jgi:Cytochrome c7 and related cytochrome c